MRKWAFLAFATIAAAAAQSVVSLHATLTAFEGDALLDDHPLERKYGLAIPLENGSDLLTRAGRAEVRLGPNDWLRLGQNGAIRMISGGVADTRVELLGGSVMLDAGGVGANPAPPVVEFEDYAIRFVQPGKYRVDSDPPQLRVYRGRAEAVKKNETPVEVGPSQIFALDNRTVVRRFTEPQDALLDLWSDERQSLVTSLATSNVAGVPMMDPLLDMGSFSLNGYAPLLGPAPQWDGPYAGPADVPVVGLFAWSPLLWGCPAQRYGFFYGAQHFRLFYPPFHPQPLHAPLYRPGAIRPVHPGPHPPGRRR